MHQMEVTCILVRAARTSFLRHLLGADRLPHLPLRCTTHTAHLPAQHVQVTKQQICMPALGNKDCAAHGLVRCKIMKVDADVFRGC